VLGAAAAKHDRDAGLHAHGLSTRGTAEAAGYR
jgi:hypothetical protein